jgi:TRAP-type C4-dicarboxylate transport system substrate-binding protein
LTHLIDGVSTAMGGLISLGWLPAVKDISLTGHQWNAFMNVFNAEKWQSLPRNVQETVEKHMDAAVLLQRRDTAIRELSVVDKLGRTGTVFNIPEKASFKAKLRSSGYYGRWKDEFGAAAWSILAKYSDVGSLS